MTAPHPQRCETCGFNRYTEGKYICCEKSEELLVSRNAQEIISIVGCASHSECQKLPNSTDLLLIAHDEWKRREERKHIHEEIAWTLGWISGFLTSKKFALERIAELHCEQDDEL